MAFEDRTLRSYVGGWPEYLRVVQERERQAAAKPKAARAKPAPRAKAAAPRRDGAAKHAIEQAELEREIEAAEAALAVVEDELADPSAWSTPDKSAKSTKRHEAAKRAVDELYSRWEQVAS